MELERPAGVEKVQVFEMTGEKAVHEKFFIISHTVTHPSNYEYIRFRNDCPRMNIPRYGLASSFNWGLPCLL
jgi:hypothetical protein